MKGDSTNAQLSQQILQEACDWFIDCNQGELDARGRRDFNQWLRRSPQHLWAYLEIAVAWENSSRLKDALPFNTTELVAAAAAENNVVPFEPPVLRPGTAGTRCARLKAGGGSLSWLFVAAAAVLFGIGVEFVSRASLYTTGIGEQRTVVLADGSVVQLDTSSRLRVQISNTGRTVELVAGQALFRVKNDAARAFVVSSGDVRVGVVGTQFDVYRKAGGTVVTVVEGRVAVTENPAATPSGVVAPALLLGEGDQLSLMPQSAPHIRHVDVSATIAWTQRRLVFDETPLSEAVAEFNRYNSRPLIIDDVSLANYHIRGSFEAGDPTRFLQFLRDRFAVNVLEQGNGIYISRYR